MLCLGIQDAKCILLIFFVFITYQLYIGPDAMSGHSRRKTLAQRPRPWLRQSMFSDFRWYASRS